MKLTVVIFGWWNNYGLISFCELVFIHFLQRAYAIYNQKKGVNATNAI